MSTKVQARHFHAGKLRKEIDGVEFVEVLESHGRVFVSEDGRVITARKPTPWLGSVDPSTGISVGPFETMTEASRATGVHLSDISYAASGKLKTAGGYVWKVVKHV